MQRTALLFLLFFGSGCAALVYEVVWIRLLTLTLSITVYSLTTVLCAFMAGLALGATLSAAFGDRLRRPVLVFAFVELGIAACGLTVPLVLSSLGPAYVWLHDLLGGTGFAFDVGRFLLAFTVLLVPSTLMGVTLPLLARAVVRRVDAVGAGTGSLYAVNTLGAVIGCVVAGFVLVPGLGLSGASACAAALNATVGFAALALSRGAEAVEPEIAPTRSEARKEDGRRGLPLDTRLAALAFGVSGFTAMGYEVLWTRALEHFTHNSTYAYTAMLAMFLLGLGVGSALATRYVDRLARPILALGSVQVAIGMSVMVALLVYARFEELVPATVERLGGLTSWGRVVGLIFTEAGLTMALTTFLLGAVFPLATRIAVDSLGSISRRVGMVYGANTVGSILGSVCVGFAVLPAFGLRGSFVALVATNLALGAGLALRYAPARGALAVAGAAATAGALLLVLIPPGVFEEQFARRFGKLLLYREAVTDTVMVTEAPDGSRMIRFADGRGTAGTLTAPEDRIYAHLPLLLHEDPKRVLQIAFGVGNSLSAALQHPIDQVDCVELSPGVIDAAPFFEATNRSALSDPRVRLVVNDGRNFLLTSRDQYDIIRLDPPELHTAGVVNLYTKEFYELARARLAEGGIFSIWINALMTPAEDLRTVVRTAAAVFPHVSVWHGPRWYSWIINGSMEPHDPDLSRMLRHFENPRVRSDLASTGMRQPFDVLGLFLFSDDALREYAGEGPLVVDDHTRVDFTTPRSKDAYFGIANYNTNHWLVLLMEPESPRRLYGAMRDRFAEFASYKTPVLPHLANVKSAGYDRRDVIRRIQAARARLEPARGARSAGDRREPGPVVAQP